MHLEIYFVNDINVTHASLYNILEYDPSQEVTMCVVHTVRTN